MDDDVLYHYCSLETLISIIKYRTIRLSDINKLNDFREAKAIIDRLRKPVANRLQVEIRGERLIYGMTSEEAIQFIANLAIDQILLNSDAVQFVFCLSKAGDQLSQWRGYGDDGKGVAIGFSKSELEELTAGFETISLGKVLYLEREIDEPFTADIVDNIAAQIIDAIASERLADILQNPYGANFFDKQERVRLLSQATFYKGDSFSEEQEYRLAFNPKMGKEEFFEQNESDDYKTIFPGWIQVRSVGNNLIPYLDFSINEVGDFIFEKIILGPNCKASDDDIVFLLKAYGLYNTAEGIDISHSESTYRK